MCLSYTTFLLHSVTYHLLVHVYKGYMQSNQIHTQHEITNIPHLKTSVSQLLSEVEGFLPRIRG